MNKTIFFLILAVCILGMALILLNQRLGRAPEPRPTARTEQSVVAEIPEPAPAQPSPAPALDPAPAPLLAPARAEESPAAPAGLPEAIERQAESDREAAAAAAAALAVEQKEATEALNSVPATAPAESTASAGGSAPATPKAPAAAATAQAPRPQTPAPAAAPAKKAAPGKEKASGPRAITRFVVFARDTGATVRITGNGPLHYKSMNLENPDRVVIDLEGDWEVKAPAVPKNPLVNAVRVGDLDGRTRIVIDLKGKPRTARVIPAKTGDSVDVRVDQ